MQLNIDITLILVFLFRVFADTGTGVVQSFAIIHTPSFCNNFRPCRQSCHSACTEYSRVIRLRGGDVVDHFDKSKSSMMLHMATAKNMDMESLSNRKMDKYHLVWSPYFWKKLVIGLVFWMIIASMQSKFNMPIGGRLFKEIADGTCHHDAVARVSPVGLILPLLSSSCCAIQLIFNAISGFGCAGFNTYLGPIRPLFLSAFLTLTIRQMQYRHPIWTIVSLVLAFLPEGVFVWNTLMTRHSQPNASVVNDFEKILPINAKITLDIPTMGCVACVNKVDSSIRSCAFSTSIKKEKSWLKDGKGGVAELVVSAGSSDDINKIVAEIQRAVNDAGFKCEVDNVQIYVQ